MIAHHTCPVAIITGASCGAGRELVSALVHRCYAAVIVYLRDQRSAEAIVDAILSTTGTALAVRADVTDELDVERLFEETAVAFGGVDVVVHAATRGAPVVFAESARRLRDGGTIVSVTSTYAIAPDLARALRARGITVNGLPAGLETASPNRDVAELVALLERWRRGPNEAR